MTRLTQLIIGLLCLILAHGGLAPNALAQNPSKGSDTAMTSKTWCIGRYAVDVPQSLSLTSLDTPIGLPRAVTVEGLGPHDADQAASAIAARADQLRAGTKVGSKHMHFTESFDMDGLRVLARQEYDPLLPGFDPGIFGAEVYFTQSGHLFRASAEAFLDLGDVAELGAAPGQVGFDDIARATRPLPADGGLDHSGICTPTALIDVPIVSDAARAIFRSEDAPGVGLIIETAQERATQSDKSDGFLTGGSRREVAGVDGQATFFADGESQRLMYEFEGIAGGQIGEPYRFISIKLFKNDAPLDAAPFSQDDLGTVWHIVTSTLRQR